jgi:hypothetical protein
VVYQSPYNTLYLHFAKLKANHIKEAGIRPVYISYGIEYDRPKKRPESPEAHLNMLHYRQYVQLFAWKIFVMHPDIRTGFYTHCLAGGSHVIAQGHPRFDAYAAGRLPRLPESLLRKAAGRPILVWQAHHFVNDESCEPSRTYSPSFAETEKMFSLLCGQSRVFIAATLHPLFVVDALNSGQATQADVDRLKSLIRESPNMALYDGDYQSLLAGADAFVTEKSSLMLEMAFLDKPTLFLQDIEVAFKPFAQDIASSYYRGKGLDDVQRFLRVVTGEAPDTAAEDRKRVKAAYFAECDGHIGERIKEHLIQSLRAEQEEQREGCRA